VGFWIVNRDDQWVTPQERQCQVEPQMPILKVDHIGIESPDLLEISVNGANLSQGLAQPWLYEGLKLHGWIQIR
jgi:hypothetical protein